MPKYSIPLTPVLDPEEYARLDDFGGARPGTGNLPALADFLRAAFATELVLDPDIIKGFTADSSNLPGRADALGRPQTERECAVLFRACLAADLPFTLAAGRSNLTGSATPLEYFGVNSRWYMAHEGRFFHGADPVGIYVQQPLTTQALEEAAGEWLERISGAACGVDENAILLMDSERDRAGSIPGSTAPASASGAILSNAMVRWRRSRCGAARRRWIRAI